MIIPAQYQLAAKLLAVVLAIGAIGGTTWKLTSDHYQQQITTINAQHEAWIAKNGQEVAEKIADANGKRAEAYKELSESRGTLDEQYSKNIRGLSDAVTKLGNIRLRDPGQTSTNGSGSGSGAGDSTTPGSIAGASTGAGLLSERASQFLLSEANRADKTVEQLRVCEAWVDNIEAQALKYNESLKQSNSR